MTNHPNITLTTAVSCIIPVSTTPCSIPGDTVLGEWAVGGDGLAESSVTLGGLTDQHEESGRAGRGGGEIPCPGCQRDCQRSELCTGKVGTGSLKLF